MTVDDLVKQREQGRCARDGQPLAGGSLHHRQLRSQFGAETLENKVGLCGSGTTGCHGWAHHNRDDAAKEGWIVSAYDNPAAVPLKHHIWGWVLPLPDQTWQLVEAPPGNDARNHSRQPIG